MDNLKLPLSVGKEGLTREKDIRGSISEYLRMLMTTPLYSCGADMDFGFIFNNLSLQNFDEGEGVVMGETGVCGKKISGSSKSLNTFASELQKSIAFYERRLDEVTVSMAYARQERTIFVTIKGVIAVTGEGFRYDTTIKVWN